VSDTLDEYPVMLVTVILEENENEKLLLGVDPFENLQEYDLR
jgi:hypothetical protein